MAEITPFIVIGNRGTAFLKGVATLPDGMKVGVHRIPWSTHPHGHSLEAWVATEDEKLRIMTRESALKAGVVKSFPAEWTWNRQIFRGVAYTRTDWKPGAEHQYIAVDADDWPHGVVETESNRTNKHRFVTNFRPSTQVQAARNYWITSHWPRRIDEPVDYNGVWVSERAKEVIKDVAAGDFVLIYESKNGRTLARKMADGSIKRVPCQVGREGVVAVVEVVQPAAVLEEAEEESYTDGSKVWWRYFAPTKSVNSQGFIPRKEAAKILGFSEEYVFRGLGEGNSGLKRLSKEEFEALLAAFLNSATAKETEALVKGGWGGPGGEGPEHLALKHRIAANPAEVLEEPGLTHFSTEYRFRTGDKVDLLLKDRFGRFVAVEVEVNCGPDEVAGPLQCMKYRAMVSYILGGPLAEIRTILAAHSVHKNVKAKCLEHSIEVREVPHL